METVHPMTDRQLCGNSPIPTWSRRTYSWSPFPTTSTWNTSGQVGQLPRSCACASFRRICHSAFIVGFFRPLVSRPPLDVCEARQEQQTHTHTKKKQCSCDWLREGFLALPPVPPPSSSPGLTGGPGWEVEGGGGCWPLHVHTKVPPHPHPSAWACGLWKRSGEVSERTGWRSSFYH